MDGREVFLVSGSLGKSSQGGELLVALNLLWPNTNCNPTRKFGSSTGREIHVIDKGG